MENLAGTWYQKFFRILALKLNSYWQFSNENQCYIISIELETSDIIKIWIFNASTLYDLFFKNIDKI